MNTEAAKGFDDAIFGKWKTSTARKLISIMSQYKIADSVRHLISSDQNKNSATQKVVKRLSAEMDTLAHEVMELLILKIDGRNVAIFEDMASILKRKSEAASPQAACAYGIWTVAKHKGERLEYQELFKRVRRQHPSLTEASFSKIVGDYGINDLIYGKPGPRPDRKKTSGIREK